MTVLSFLAVLERAPTVTRVIECDSERTLHDLHHALQDAFNWDDDHLYAFYLGGRGEHDRRHEYVCPRTDFRQGLGPIRPPKRAELAELGGLELRPGRTFLYLFDFGDRWLVRLTLRDIDASRSLERWRIVESIGMPPPQYGAWKADEEDAALADDLPRCEEECEAGKGIRARLGDRNDLIEEWEAVFDKEIDAPAVGDDDEERPSLSAFVAATERAGELAERIVKAFAGDLELLREADETTDGRLLMWLREAPFRLGRAERLESALALFRSLQGLMTAEEFDSDLALLLAESGRAEEARERILACRAHHPESFTVRFNAARVFSTIGENDAAERLILEIADDESIDIFDRENALDYLLAIYRHLGRRADERRILARLDPPFDPWAVPSEEARLWYESDLKLAQAWSGIPFVRSSPKTGRNDPCPCGAGKKFKKCCGS